MSIVLNRIARKPYVSQVVIAYKLESGKFWVNSESPGGERMTGNEFDSVEVRCRHFYNFDKSENWGMTACGL